jgi:hypothetical protein
VSNTTDLKKSYRFAGGFLAGLGSAFIIFGISIWYLVSGIINVFASWLEEHGYTMAPSGVATLNQMPIISMATMVVGFVFILIGIVLAVRAKD